MAKEQQPQQPQPATPQAPAPVWSPGPVRVDYHYEINGSAHVRSLNVFIEHTSMTAIPVNAIEADGVPPGPLKRGRENGQWEFSR